MAGCHPNFSPYSTDFDSHTDLAESEEEHYVLAQKLATPGNIK